MHDKPLAMNDIEQSYSSGLLNIPGASTKNAKKASQFVPTDDHVASVVEGIKTQQERFDLYGSLLSISGLKQDIATLKDSHYLATHKKLNPQLGSVYPEQVKDLLDRISKLHTTPTLQRKLECELEQDTDGKEMANDRHLKRVMSTKDEDLQSAPLLRLQKYFALRVSKLDEIYKHDLRNALEEKRKGMISQEGLEERTKVATDRFEKKREEIARWAVSRGMELLGETGLVSEVRESIDQRVVRKISEEAEREQKAKQFAKETRLPIFSRLSYASDVDKDFEANKDVLLTRPVGTAIDTKSGRRWIIAEEGGDRRYYYNSDSKNSAKHTFGRVDSNSVFISEDGGKSFVETKLMSVASPSGDRSRDRAFLLDKERNVYDPTTGQKLQPDADSPKINGSDEIIPVYSFSVPLGKGRNPGVEKIIWNKEKQMFCAHNPRMYENEKGRFESAEMYTDFDPVSKRPSRAPTLIPKAELAELKEKGLKISLEGRDEHDAKIFKYFVGNKIGGDVIAVSLYNAEGIARSSQDLAEELIKELYAQRILTRGGTNLGITSN